MGGQTTGVNESLYPKRLKIRWRWDGDAGDFITYQNPATGAISILNPVAAAIFAKSTGERSAGQIADEIMQEFDAPDRGRVLADTMEFLQFLCEIGAVRMLEG